MPAGRPKKKNDPEMCVGGGPRRFGFELSANTVGAAKQRRKLEREFYGPHNDPYRKSNRYDRPGRVHVS